jgi:putative component of toxin-antitoxin plasmid stabilization module
MNIRVEEYIRPDGSSPYADWFNRLDAQAAAKIVTAKLRMELGNMSNVKWFSGIGEYVIDWGPGYRRPWQRPEASDRRGKRDGTDAGFQEDSCRSSRA